MTRMTLIGSVAAGLMAAAATTPAFAQATSYPAGTDCAALQSAADRTSCTQQMNESRENPQAGDNVDGGASNTSDVPSSSSNQAPTGTESTTGTSNEAQDGSSPDGSETGDNTAD